MAIYELANLAHRNPHGVSNPADGPQAGLDWPRSISERVPVVMPASCESASCVSPRFSRSWRIDGLSDRPDTLGDYAATWTERHPRSERTNATNDHRISRVADVEIEGIPLKDWPLRELRRRHTFALVDHMLRTEGRATTGAVGILRAVSAMAEDAITDEVCDLKPLQGRPHPS